MGKPKSFPAELWEKTSDCGVRSVLLGVFLVWSSAGWAQINTGKIVGFVTDPSGAAIPDATVNATNVATGVVTSTQSGQAGSYLLNYLAPGTYTVKFTKTGFATRVENSVQVTAGYESRIDAQLSLGQVVQTVQVKANPVAVNSENAEEKFTFSDESIEALPNVDRNPLYQLNLMPGANNGVGSQNYGTNGNEDGSAAALSQPQLASFGGLDANANSVFIEGIPTREPQNGYISLVPPPDAIEELDVYTGKYDAEFGVSASGFINIVTKSGTNHFHGDVFEYVENDALNARPFFATSKTPFKRNQFGGSFGGPIKRDKLFFFADYQGTRNPQTFPNIASAPTAKMYNGDFSELYDPTQPPDAAGNTYGQLYNPFTRVLDAQGNVVSVTPFAGNIIPQALWDPASAKMNAARIFGTANLPGIVNNLYYLDYLDQSPDQGDGRIDYSLSTNSKLFFRYSLFKTPILTGSNVNQFIQDGASSHTLNQNMGLTFDHTFSSSQMNELRIGYNRSNVHTFSNSQNQPYNNQFGIPNGDLGDFATQGLAEFFVDPLKATGQPDWVAYVTSNNINLTDSFTWVKGRHTLKFGTNLFHIEDTSADTIGGDDPRGRMDFNPSMTSYNGIAADFDYPSFLLGTPVDSIRTRFVKGFPYQTYWQDGFFAQDDFHVKPSLTLNLGLRWELYTLPVERFNRQSNWDTRTNELVVATANDRSPAIATDTGDWEPRIGVAWSPDHGKTSLRAGWGISYWQNYWNYAQSVLTVLGATYPFYVKQAFLASSSLSPTVVISTNGIPVGQATYGSQGNLLIPPGALIRGADYNYKNQKVDQVSVDVQRQLTPQLLVDVGYLGVFATNNPVTVNVNQAPPSPIVGVNYQLNRPLYDQYPQLGDVPVSESTGSSNYNALTATVRGNINKYVQVFGTYAFGRNFSNGLNTATGNVFGTPPDLNQYYGPTPEDMPLIFNLEVVSQLPFGRGMPLLSNIHPVLNQIIGGWQATTHIHISSGPRFTVTTPVSLLNNGQGNNPNVTCNPNLPSSQRTLTNWFNGACFANDLVAGTWGNEGTDILRADGQQQVNFSLFKQFKISERFSLQLRGDFLDLFNHPNFSPPGSPAVGNPAMGAITSTSAGPRFIQLGLRLAF
jgi:hypothetical protein